MYLSNQHKLVTTRTCSIGKPGRDTRCHTYGVTSHSQGKCRRACLTCLTENKITCGALYAMCLNQPVRRDFGAGV